MDQNMDEKNNKRNQHNPEFTNISDSHQARYVQIGDEIYLVGVPKGYSVRNIEDGDSPLPPESTEALLEYIAQYATNVVGKEPVVTVVSPTDAVYQETEYGATTLDSDKTLVFRINASEFPDMSDRLAVLHVADKSAKFGDHGTVIVLPSDDLRNEISDGYDITNELIEGANVAVKYHNEGSRYSLNTLDGLVR